MKRDSLLTVQIVTAGNELSGEPAETWTTEAVIWCSVKPLSGREYVAARQLESSVTHTITSEYIDGANPAMRLVQLSTDGMDTVLRQFHIDSVINVDEGNRELLWRAIEVV